MGASYGFAVNKGQNAELLQMFNAGLQNLRDDGQYDEIVSTYLGQGASTSDNSIIGLIKSTYAASQGLWLTIVLSVVSIAIALVLGAIFGLCRVSTNMFVRGIARPTSTSSAAHRCWCRHSSSTSASRQPAFPDVRLHRRHHHALAQRRRVHG